MIVCFVFLKYQFISSQFSNTTFSGWTHDNYKWYEGHRTSSKITMDHQTALQLGISCIEPLDLLTDRDSRWIDFTAVRKWIRPVSDILMLAKHAIFTATGLKTYTALQNSWVPQRKLFLHFEILIFSFKFLLNGPLITQVNWARWQKWLRTLFRTLQNGNIESKIHPHSQGVVLDKSLTLRTWCKNFKKPNLLTHHCAYKRCQGGHSEWNVANTLLIELRCLWLANASCYTV